MAQETLDIYAPLANRLGMQEVKDQLEDLALATLHPKRYSQIDQMVQDRSPERDLYLAQVIGEVEGRLGEVGISGRGRRSTQAAVEHLREDDREGSALRRDSRPGWGPGRRRKRA